SSSEGMHRAWFRGKWFTFEQVTRDQIVLGPKWIWWVKIKNARGQIGWTDQTFEFQGVDVLGGPDPSPYRFYHAEYLPRAEWTVRAPGILIRPIVGATGTLTIADVQPGAMTVLPPH